MGATSATFSTTYQAAIVMTLNPGAYTAVVSGVGNTSGIALLSVTEVDRPGTPLLNFSTRGQVQSGNNIMIGGFVIGGATPKTVLIRGRGPSLAGAGITMPLPNPVLQVLNGTTVIASNDNWPSAANVGAISATGLQPSNNAEAAVLVRLNPGRTPCSSPAPTRTPVWGCSRCSGFEGYGLRSNTPTSSSAMRFQPCDSSAHTSGHEKSAPTPPQST